MTYAPPSTIAQLLFESVPAKPFSALVRDLDDALSRIGGDRHTTWDHDDMVFVDLDGTRVGMGFAEQTDAGYAACLTVSVGPTPGSEIEIDPGRHAKLCDRIASRAAESLGAVRILWHEVDEPVTADLVDELIDRLPAVAANSPHGPTPPEPVTADLVDRLLDRHPFPEKPAFADRLATAPLAETPPAEAEPASPVNVVVKPDLVAAAPDQVPDQAPPVATRRAARKITLVGAKAKLGNRPGIRRMGSAELDPLRHALYDQEETDPTTNAQRIAAMTMNVTLTIVMPPVGATLLAASWRGGTDLRTSARAMAMTGSLFAFAHSAAAADVASYLVF